MLKREVLVLEMKDFKFKINDNSYAFVGKAKELSRISKLITKELKND
jgi:hypothetical protein